MSGLWTICKYRLLPNVRLGQIACAHADSNSASKRSKHEAGNATCMGTDLQDSLVSSQPVVQDSSTAQDTALGSSERQSVDTGQLEQENESALHLACDVTCLPPPRRQHEFNRWLQVADPFCAPIFTPTAYFVFTASGYLKAQAPLPPAP